MKVNTLTLALPLATLLGLSAATPLVAESQPYSDQPNSANDSLSDQEYNHNASQTEPTQSMPQKSNASNRNEQAAQLEPRLISDAQGAETLTPSSRLVLRKNMTALGIIGQPVYNDKGGRVAQIEDIIVNEDGEASMVILSDEDWLGMGKNVAFDYNYVMKKNADGDSIAPMSEELLETAASFTYDRDNVEADQRTIPIGGHSIAKLLEARLVDRQGDKLGDVENIAFKDGKTTSLIVSFGGFLGMGKEKAALNFKALDLAPKENTATSTAITDEVNFQLDPEKTVEFNKFKRTVEQQP